MQNDGSPPFSKRERASNASFNSDFDPDTLMQYPFLDESSEKDVDFSSGNHSQSSLMDLEPDSIQQSEANIEVALKQAHKNVMANLQLENQGLYQSQALSQYAATPLEQMQGSATTSTPFNAGMQSHSEMYQDTASFHQQQNPDSDDVFSQISSVLRAQQMTQNSIGNQTLVDERGYPLYQSQVATNQTPMIPQLPTQVGSGLGTSSSLQFNTNQKMSNAALSQVSSTPQGFANTAPFEADPLRMNPPLIQHSMEQDLGKVRTNNDQISPSTTFGVNAQLEHMEKLCETMRRSAVTRNLIKQLSNRSVTSQDTSKTCTTVSSSNRDGDLSGCVSREGSAGNVFKQVPTRQHTKPAPGRGLSRGITVSGRGLGRQGSARSISSSGHSRSDGDSERFTPTLPPGSRCENPIRRRSVGSIDAVIQARTSQQGFNSAPCPQPRRSASSTFRQVSTIPGRGIQRRHRSNPTLIHRLDQVQDGAMDTYFDGACDTDSV